MRSQKQPLLNRHTYDATSVSFLNVADRTHAFPCGVGHGQTNMVASWSFPASSYLRTWMQKIL